MPPSSSVWRNSDQLADGQLASTIVALCDAGNGWRTIARTLNDAYGITVSHVTVGTWLATLRADLEDAA